MTSAAEPARASRAPQARRLIVLRHGRTGHNQLGIWQGHLDISLDDVGRAQALVAAEALRGEQPAFIVSSDLARARETADAVGAACGLPVERDARLREIHVGQWQGQRHSDIADTQRELVAALDAGHDPRRGVDGETVAEVAERARPAVLDCLDRLEPGQTGLLVSHGVTALALVADLVGLDQRTAWTSMERLGNCAWAVLEEHLHRAPRAPRPDGRTPWRLAGWNLRAPDLGMGRSSG